RLICCLISFFVKHMGTFKRSSVSKYDFKRTSMVWTVRHDSQSESLPLKSASSNCLEWVHFRPDENSLKVLFETFARYFKSASPDADAFFELQHCVQLLLNKRADF